MDFFNCTGSIKSNRLNPDFLIGRSRNQSGIRSPPTNQRVWIEF